MTGGQETSEKQTLIVDDSGKILDEGGKEVSKQIKETAKTLEEKIEGTRETANKLVTNTLGRGDVVRDARKTTNGTSGAFRARDLASDDIDFGLRRSENMAPRRRGLGGRQSARTSTFTKWTMWLHPRITRRQMGAARATAAGQR